MGRPPNKSDLGVAELRQIVEDVGGVRATARLVGCDHKSISKHLSGVRSVPLENAVLLRQKMGTKVLLKIYITRALVPILFVKPSLHPNHPRKLIDRFAIEREQSRLFNKCHWQRRLSCRGLDGIRTKRKSVLFGQSL